MDNLASPPSEQRQYKPLKFWFCDDIKHPVPLPAWLMMKYGWSAEKAFEYVKRTSGWSPDDGIEYIRNMPKDDEEAAEYLKNNPLPPIKVLSAEAIDKALKDEGLVEEREGIYVEGLEENIDSRK